MTGSAATFLKAIPSARDAMQAPVQNGDSKMLGHHGVETEAQSPQQLLISALKRRSYPGVLEVLTAKEVLCSAQRVFASFNSEVLTPALSKYLKETTGDPTCHPQARIAMFPSVISAAQKAPDQTVEQLVSSLSVRRQPGKKLVDGQPTFNKALQFKTSCGGSEWHDASAQCGLTLGDPSIDASCASYPTVSEVSHTAELASLASQCLALAFDLREGLRQLHNQGKSLVVSGAAERIECDWTDDGVLSCVAHPSYYIRLLNPYNALPLLCRMCDELISRQTAENAASSLSSQERRSLCRRLRPYKYPGPRVIWTDSLLVDEVYNCLCLDNPALSKDFHWRQAGFSNRQRMSQDSFEEIVFVSASQEGQKLAYEQRSTYQEAEPISVWGSSPDAERAKLRAADSALDQVTSKLGRERAELVRRVFDHLAPTFTGGSYDRWVSRIVASTRADTTLLCPEEVAEGLRLFLEVFHDAVVTIAIKRTTCSNG